MDIPGFRVIKPRVRERERQTRVQAILGYIETGPNPSNHSERAHSTTRFKVRAEVELRDPDVTRIGF